jgi:hypothetical protein
MVLLNTETYDGDVPTTRRFPRALWEAFPDTRAPSIELPAPRKAVNEWGHRAVLAVGIVVLCVVIAALLVERLAS